MSLLAKQVTQGEFVPKPVYLEIFAYQGRKITSGGFELLLTDLITVICAITGVEYYKPERKRRTKIIIFSHLCYLFLIEEASPFLIGFLSLLYSYDEQPLLRTSHGNVYSNNLLQVITNYRKDSLILRKPVKAKLQHCSSCIYCFCNKLVGKVLFNPQGLLVTVKLSLRATVMKCQIYLGQQSMIWITLRQVLSAQTWTPLFQVLHNQGTKKKKNKKKLSPAVHYSSQVK